SAPFLGRPTARCLEEGEISLRYDDKGLFLAYYEHRFPLALNSYGQVFGRSDGAPEKEEVSDEVAAWLDRIGKLTRWRDPLGQGLKGLRLDLWMRYTASPDIRRLVDRQLASFNGEDRHERLVRLIKAQYFHLCPWQTAAGAINYRRFFSINGLIAVRQEDRRVFDMTHALAARLARSGVFTGLRVDHIDGLLSPGRYLNWIRDACGDCFLVVEKITASDERLPAHWPVQGTTGYEFAAHLDRLFAFAEGEAALTGIYAEFCGPQPAFQSVVAASKAQVLQQEFKGDLDNLTARFRALPELEGVSVQDLRESLGLLLVHMPVYRTYLGDRPLRKTDYNFLNGAVEAAAAQRGDMHPCLLRLRDLMLSTGDRLADARQAHPVDNPLRRAVGAFEQLCAALTAKGVEDTAMYRYHRLSALNDVGADPRLFAESPA
ncbi:MAG: hypothetical protein P8X55_21560, partial [Desulfosarcinaceae bacterium]